MKYSLYVSETSTDCSSNKRRKTESNRAKNIMTRKIVTVFMLAMCFVGSVIAEERNKNGDVQENSGSAKRSPPNVILIIGDDMTFEDFGCYGNTAASTPNIDKLAKGGIRFNQAYCTESKCAASRASIMLGRPPHATFMPELNRKAPMNETQLYSRMNNMAHDFKKAGYYTIHEWKWHIGYSWDKATGYFKQFYDRTGNMRNKKLGGEENWISILRDKRTPANQPIFCWFAPTDAHTPFTAPVHHKSVDMPMPPYVPDIDDAGLGVNYRDARAKYMDEIKRMDDYIGLLVQELKDNPKFDFENTVIIITADNGRPFSRDKWWNYDHSTRMPLIIHWPGGITQPGSTSDALISLMDLAPTLSELLGNDPAATTYIGKSFLPLITGNPDQEHNTYVYTEYNWGSWRGHERAIRDKQFLYIRNSRPGLMRRSPVDTAAGGDNIYHIAKKNGRLGKNQEFFFVGSPKEEFYDRIADPYQLTNLIGTATAKQTVELNRLRDQLTKWQRETGDTVPDVLTSDDRKRVKSDPKPVKVLGEVPGWNSLERFLILMGKNRLDPADTSGTDLNGPNDDPDGDGVSNLKEYQKGTDPLEGLGRRRIISK
jgi:N-sulfoglucosamine sulfohydrolase